MTQKETKLETPLPPVDVLVILLSFFSWLGDTSNATREIHEMWRLEVGSAMTGTGLYLTKRRYDEETSSFVVTRKNLFPSYCMTHTEGGKESSGSDQISLSSPTPLTSIMSERERPIQMQHRSRNAQLLMPQRKHSESIYRIV